MVTVVFIKTVACIQGRGCCFYWFWNEHLQGL